MVLGVLTDIVVADASEASAVAADGDRLRTWPGVDAKGVDSVKLAILWGLLSNDPSKANAGADFETLHEIPDEGPWVFRVPEELVQLLASLDDAGAASTAVAWAKAEEFVLDGWNAAAVRSILSELRTLARKTLSGRKSMLMWMSL